MDLLQASFQLFQKYHRLFLKGMSITLFLAVVGTCMGLLLGFILSSLRNAQVQEGDGFMERVFKNLGRAFSSTYIEIVRGTPMIAQSVFVYYSLYKVLGWTPLIAGLVIVSFNTAAYMAEILRAGIQSIDKGQREAALSLGMSDAQTFRLIILPQAVRHAFPAIGNEFVVNIKDSSVLNVISVTELFFTSMSVAGASYNFQASMLIIIVTYFLLTFSVTRVLYFLEGKLQLKRKTLPVSQTVPEAF